MQSPWMICNLFLDILQLKWCHVNWTANNTAYTTRGWERDRGKGKPLSCRKWISSLGVDLGIAWSNPLPLQNTIKYSENRIVKQNCVSSKFSLLSHSGIPWIPVFMTILSFSCSNFLNLFRTKMENSRLAPSLEKSSCHLLILPTSLSQKITVPFILFFPS